MGGRSFFFQLGILTILFSALALVTGFIPVLAPYATIFWLSIALYTCFSLAVHYLGKKAIRSSNKYAFTNVTIGSIAGKLLFSVILVVVYKKLADPPDNFFVIPFLLVYLCYTIFGVLINEILELKKLRF